MKRIGINLVHAWARLGPRWLPFADAATTELPLQRLLRLSLFQVSWAWPWACWWARSTAC